MRAPRLILASVAWILSHALVMQASWAEVPTLSKKDRESQADMVVDVEILGVETAKRTAKGFLHLKHNIKVKSLSFKKNPSGFKAGRIFSVRTWNQQWRGQGDAPPHSVGHALKAKVAERYTLYLKSAKDGGLDVLLPNGFEPLN